MSTWIEIAQRAADGLPLAVTVTAPHERTVLQPGQVEALVAASRQVLANVVHHAGVRDASWIAEVSRDQVVVTIADEGAGIAPGAEPGVGLRDSVIGRIERIGGSVAISPGEPGTVVRLVVPRRTRRRSVLAETYERTTRLLGAQNIARLSLLVAGPTAVASTVVGTTHGLFGPHGPVEMAALVAVVALTAFVVLRMSSGRASPTAYALLVVGVPVALWCAMQAAGPGAALDFRSWMILTFAMPMMLLAYVTPLWLVPLYVLPSFLVVLVPVLQGPAGEVAPSVAAVGTTLVPVLAALLGRVQRRATQRLLEDEQRLVEAEVAHETATRLREAQRRHLATSSGHVLPFLRRLASGELDPSDPDVRRRAATLAAMARDDLYNPGILTPGAQVLVAGFRERGGRFVMRPGMTAQTARAPLDAALAGLVPQLGAGHTITVSLVRQGGLRLAIVPAIAGTVTARALEELLDLPGVVAQVDNDEVSTTLRLLAAPTRSGDGRERVDALQS